MILNEGRLVSVLYSRNVSIFRNKSYHIATTSCFHYIFLLFSCFRHSRVRTSLRGQMRLFCLRSHLPQATVHKFKGWQTITRDP